MALSVEDKFEIQELAVRYANAMDDGDLNAWLSTWDENGIWEGGIGRYEGAALRNLLTDLGARIQGKRHVMTNFVISEVDSTVNLKSYLLVFERETGTKCVATGVYNDKLTKVGGEWKFAHRTVKLDPSFALQSK